MKLRHLLVRAVGLDEAQKTVARAKADAALAEARAGKNFADLVKQYSDEQGAAQGGDLGWITRGQLMPALDAPVFALKKGDVSGIIESPLGYHIFKVDDVKEEKKTDLKEATPEIAKALKIAKGKMEAVRAADQDREKLPRAPSCPCSRRSAGWRRSRRRSLARRTRFPKSPPSMN
jgi:peptidyl-prolyl cis-trans isomerase D